jgi:hypothetical protein
VEEQDRRAGIGAVGGDADHSEVGLDIAHADRLGSRARAALALRP